MMKVDRAIEIVMELARQNVITEFNANGNEALEQQRSDQLEAIGTIEDFFTNVVYK